MVTLDFSGIALKIRQDDDKVRVFDPVRKRWIVLTPEEHVRQYFLKYLTQGMEYPLSLIAVEKKILVGKIAKRFDVVVFGKNHEPWMLVECKEPDVLITEATLFQLLTYHSSIHCSYWVLTNGHQTYCADARNLAEITWMDSLPLYNS